MRLFNPDFGADPAGRASHRARILGLGHAATIGANGPSRSFLGLTRNPDLASPARFEPTIKRDGDVVL